MPSEIHAIRDFALQIEKTLNARRLYRRGSSSHAEAGQRLRESCIAAAAERGFTLRIGPTDLFVDKTPLLNREKTEDAYFFPLYRDGLRELRFHSDVSLEGFGGQVFKRKYELKGQVSKIRDIRAG